MKRQEEDRETYTNSSYSGLRSKDYSPTLTLALFSIQTDIFFVVFRLTQERKRPEIQKTENVEYLNRMRNGKCIYSLLHALIIGSIN